jgi:hypothetical protein
MWPERGAPASYRLAAPTLKLHNGAALFLSNKSSHYLLHDLEQIHADPAPFLEGLGDRPLNPASPKPTLWDREQG